MVDLINFMRGWATAHGKWPSSSTSKAKHALALAAIDRAEPEAEGCLTTRARSLWIGDPAGMQDLGTAQRWLGNCSSSSERLQCASVAWFDLTEIRLPCYVWDHHQHCRPPVPDWYDSNGQTEQLVGTCMAWTVFIHSLKRNVSTWLSEMATGGKGCCIQLGLPRRPDEHGPSTLQQTCTAQTGSALSVS